MMTCIEFLQPIVWAALLFQSLWLSRVQSCWFRHSPSLLSLLLTPWLTCTTSRLFDCLGNIHQNVENVSFQINSSNWRQHTVFFIIKCTGLILDLRTWESNAAIAHTNDFVFQVNNSLRMLIISLWTTTTTGISKYLLHKKPKSKLKVMTQFVVQT